MIGLLTGRDTLLVGIRAVWAGARGHIAFPVPSQECIFSDREHAAAFQGQED